ncbi:MAG: F0F1 ATP synthase subunit gamma, partial [Patescibacteria group bacterium]
MSLKNIKLKIRSVDQTRKVTKAMEAVSAVKMRKSQTRALTGRPYARAALSVLSRLSGSLKTIRHRLTVVRPLSRVAVVVITSDKGLCGVLNAAVIREADRAIKELGLPAESVSIYAFGKKGAEFFERRGYDLKVRFDNVSDDVQIVDFENVGRALATAFSLSYFDRVIVVYTRFKSTFEQFAVSRAVLPLSVEAMREIVEGIIPERGVFAEKRMEEPPAPAYYTVEPSPETVLDTLI